MDNNENFFSQVQALEEDKTVDLNSVKLMRSWVFWENYEAKGGAKMDWNDSIKRIFSFTDIITFLQFWNNYYGSNPANIFYDGLSLKQIVGLNLFEEGISPKWEDPKNANGYTFTLSYEIRDRDDLSKFLNLIGEYFLKLIMIVVGESFSLYQYVNGIRLIDKTIVGKKTMFRMEIWLRQGAEQEKLDELKKSLTNMFGSEVAVNKIQV